MAKRNNGKALVKDMAQRPSLAEFRAGLEAWSGAQGKSATQRGLQAFMNQIRSRGGRLA